MFGIGFGELLVIAIVVLIAVGPRRMPAMMKSVGRGLRDLRKATRELRAQIGLDEILYEDESVRPVTSVHDFGRAIATRWPVKARDAAPGRNVPSRADLRHRELPPEGVDLAEAEVEAQVAELGALDARVEGGGDEREDVRRDVGRR
jgi:sec-independent protein translocase protein TatB